MDGIAQLKDPHLLKKTAEFQDLPAVPNWDKEKNETVDWEGLPPLTGHRLTGRVRITGVKSLVGFDNMSDGHDLQTVFDLPENDHHYPGGRTVVVEQGQIVCTQTSVDNCSASLGEEETVIDLAGGAIEPGLTTYGSPLGLVEIRLEPSTNDGPVLDPLNDRDIPASVVGAGVIRAVDGLAFEGRGALYVFSSPDL